MFVVEYLRHLEMFVLLEMLQQNNFCMIRRVVYQNALVSCTTLRGVHYMMLRQIFTQVSLPCVLCASSILRYVVWSPYNRRRWNITGVEVVLLVLSARVLAFGRLVLVTKALNRFQAS
jgi:hypothetical protein